ncbi:MAG: glycoside hydrolase family 25 protein [Pedobacter sp.]|nr:MAG: glycoside hydrolase family 25 protein [Pedobacter sp.]
MPPVQRKTPAPLKPIPKNRKPAVKRTPRKKKQSGMSLPVKFAIVALFLVLLSPFYYAYIIKGFSSTWRWISDWGEDPNYRTYSSFDIKIPKGHTIHGIDVSYYQGKIDWQQVKSMKEDDVNISFAFIKATEGLFNVDPYFQRNWREAPKAGIICGAYHYLIPKKSGEWQAKFFLQTVKFEKGDLPPVCDVEELNGIPASRMRVELKAFLKHVEKKTGVKPIIYTGLSFYKDYLDGYFDDYPLWIAHYYQPKLKVSKKTNWHFWQHSDKAKISGINHVVDFNAFNGDSLAFDRMLIR